MCRTCAAVRCCSVRLFTTKCHGLPRKKISKLRAMKFMSCPSPCTPKQRNRTAFNMSPSTGLRPQPPRVCNVSELHTDSANASVVPPAIIKRWYARKTCHTVCLRTSSYDAVMSNWSNLSSTTALWNRAIFATAPAKGCLLFVILTKHPTAESLPRLTDMSASTSVGHVGAASSITSLGET